MNIKIKKVFGILTTETMTKTYGEQLLNCCKNERKLKIRHVEFIKRSLVYSGWNNSSVISVSKSGELLDGQHRLNALKELGWPNIKVQVCTYDDSDLTPQLRSSFNKAVKQSVSDTMKMCYGWDNVTRRCGICAAMFRAFISKNGMEKCDDVETLHMDKVFGDEISAFVSTTTPHDRGVSRFNSGATSAFVAMMIYRGVKNAGAIHELLRNSECRLNCDSLNCIAARINDFVYSTRNHSGEQRSQVYRICMAIDMYLNGKRVCKPLSKFKDIDVFEFGDIIRPVIRNVYDSISDEY